MKKRKKAADENTPGYAVFTLALAIGLLINVSASIVYDMFLKNNVVAEYVVLTLTLASFGGLIYLYHSRLHEPLAKFLQEFE